MNTIDNPYNKSWNFKIHLNHFVNGMPAIARHAIKVALVGMIAFEKPSPNWKINTEVCEEIPIKSPSGAMIGIVNAA